MKIRPRPLPYVSRRFGAILERQRVITANTIARQRRRMEELKNPALRDVTHTAAVDGPRRMADLRTA